MSDKRILDLQGKLVSVMGLTVLLVSLISQWDTVVQFFVENWHVIIEHTLMGIVFACTGAWARGMCEHTWHKIALGGTLILAEGIFTVAVIG